MQSYATTIPCTSRSGTRERLLRVESGTCAAPVARPSIGLGSVAAVAYWIELHPPILRFGRLLHEKAYRLILGAWLWIRLAAGEVRGSNR